ncbi:MAG: tetratricopeptide repeat protein [Rhizobiaceae bacterium]
MNRKQRRATQKAQEQYSQMESLFMFSGQYLHAGNYEEAIAGYRRILRHVPDNAASHHNLGVSYESLGQYAEAIMAYKNSYKYDPASFESCSNLGGLLHKLHQSDKAILMLEKAIEINPGFADAHHNLGCTLSSLGRLEEAIQSHRKALACQPDFPITKFELCGLRRMICDWPGLETENAACLQEIYDRSIKVSPFRMLPMSSNPLQQLRFNRLYAGDQKVADASIYHDYPLLDLDRDDRKVRIGYLSSDFNQHAVSVLIAELLERHDRDRFEIFGFCYSKDDGSETRARVVSAFDKFVPVLGMSDYEAANCIREEAIDILVDLKGYTRDARTRILAHHPAPIQVNFLGYPSTMGADFIDYIIGDPQVTPMHHQPHYDEAIVQLSQCYMPNDTKRKISQQTQSRKAHGLPEEGFVFCSFNNSYKITEELFSIWMGLLKQLEGSVLWLFEANPLCKANLQREALALGIGPERLVFAPKLPKLEDHLARYRLADLFLDSTPYNAHTTASDALWSGLPVLSCAGDTFASRVAGSLLCAIELPELAVNSLEEYEAMALKLAKDASLLKELRRRLEANRLSTPLFDIVSYTQDIEAAYLEMVRIHREGLAPSAFSVGDI